MAFNVRFSGLLLASLLLFVAVEQSHAFRYLEKGGQASPFTMETLEGDGFELSGELGEKATVLFFWAVWNPRSHDALADHQKLYAEYSDKGLQVIGVNVEHEELAAADMVAIKSTVAEGGITFPVLLDEGLAVYAAYGISAVPSIALLDAKGVAVELLPGYPPHLRDEFKDKVVDALGLLVRSVEPVKQAGYKPKGKAGRYFGMAKLFIKKGMRDRGVKSLRKALEEDPDYEEAKTLLRELVPEEQ